MSREQEFRAKYAVLFDSHPHAVFMLTPDGEIVECNERASIMAGYTMDELPGMKISALFSDDIAAIVSALGDGGNAVCTTTGVCMKKDGAVIPVEFDMRSFHAGGENGIYVLVRDIADMKEAEDEITRLSRRLRQSEKMEVIGSLAGGITHYYNNIFTGILGALNMAKDDVSDEMLPLLRRAEKVAHTASGFTRRLLTFTRETDSVSEPINIHALVADVLDFSRATFDRRIDIEADIPSDLDAVLADPAALHHTLLNLFVNARDTLLEKAETVSWEPKLLITLTAGNVSVDKSQVASGSCVKPGRFVRIAVTDTGCGMDEATRNHALEPFFTTKGPGKGTGLGLPSAESTAVEAGGWLEIDSEPDKGTSIALYLPSVTMSRTVTRETDAEDLPRGDETVLIVDDDDMIRTLGTMTLERQGYTVLSAVDGGDGFEAFMKNRGSIELIILDLLLPVLSGADMLKRIRRVEPGIPVIVTSGHDFERDKGLFAELRADDYIVKPFNIVDLVVSVRNVLDRRSD